MSIETNKQFLIDYVRQSVVLQSPETEKDPAYVFSDEDIFNIIKMCIGQHNANYTVENFPDNEQAMLVILARKEIYWRLATSSAKFYPISAEGAELRKDYRFKHYFQLIQELEKQYSSVKASFMEQNPNLIQVGRVFVDSKHFNLRQMNLQQLPKVDIKVINTTSNSVDIAWTKFNTIGGMFSSYEVYYNDSPVYDEFEELVTGVHVASIRNINRTKLRVKDLKPNTKYYLAIIVKDTNLLQGVSQVEFTTQEEGTEDATK